MKRGPVVSTGGGLAALALATGPAAWAVHLVGGSALVPLACERDAAWMIDALTVVTAAVCLAGATGGVLLRRRADTVDMEVDEQVLRLLAFLAIVANGLSLALVVAEGLMHVWIPACAG